ncbi:hypothetical protein SEA_CICADA_43 [Microbacterium phage Cicada]|nr:hypothetical protein SEA_CICADA_43 [Microbacterium phage Cicada]
MAHFYLLNRTPLLVGPGEPERTKDTEIKITNGVARVSLIVGEQYVTLEADNAAKLGAALLVGAFNARHGLHANSDQAQDYDDLGIAAVELELARAN